MNRDKKVSVRMTSEELKEIKKRAANHSLSISRFLLLQGLERPIFYKAEKSVEQDSYLYQLASMRNSFEKCMRLIRTGKGGKIEEAEMNILIDKIKGLMLKNQDKE